MAQFDRGATSIQSSRDRLTAGNDRITGTWKTVGMPHRRLL